MSNRHTFTHSSATPEFSGTYAVSHFNGHFSFQWQAGRFRL
jgi:hypothetical protein